MTAILFESPWLLALIWLAVQFVLVAVWSKTRREGAGRAVWIGFAALPVLLVAGALVDTPREQMTQALRDLAKAAEQGDMAAIESGIARDFRAGAYNRETFLARVERALTRYNIEDARLSRLDVEPAGGSMGTAEFLSSATVIGDEAMSGRVIIRWRVKLQRRGQVWQVTEAEVLAAPMSPVRDLGDLLR